MGCLLVRNGVKTPINGLLYNWVAGVITPSNWAFNKLTPEAPRHPKRPPRPSHGCGDGETVDCWKKKWLEVAV